MASSADKEERKVDFHFDVEKLREDEFLNKLSSTVKRIGEYKDHLGSAAEDGRKMKMQGVVKSDVTIDINKHFQKFDPVAE